MFGCVKSLLLLWRRDDVSAHCQITTDTLNRHYASVSTDSNYRAPLTKQTTDLRDDQFLTEIFKQLDKLHHTATGLVSTTAGRCRFRQTNRKAVQRIAGQISRAITVEKGLDLSYPQNKESYRQ